MILATVSTFHFLLNPPNLKVTIYIFSSKHPNLSSELSNFGTELNCDAEVF